METMIRKEWGSPKGNVQRFTPQEFVAACYPVENLKGGNWFIDFYTMGTYGEYDNSAAERINDSWTPTLFNPSGGGSYQVDVYRWCNRESANPSNYNLNHTNHRWAGSPAHPNERWGWYDEIDPNDWNGWTQDPNGHFVLGATKATLKISASGNKAVIVGTFSPEVGGSGIATSAS